MAQATQINSHWSTMIEGLNVSPQQFFQEVEHAVRAKEVPDTVFSRIHWREGGLMSAKREYLRVKRKELVFDICGAPFGNGFFVSWWLGDLPSGFLGVLLRIPFVSVLTYWWMRVFKTETYYKHDTAAMYQALVHAAVLSVIDHMTESTGLKALAPEDRTPQMRNFFDV